MTLPNFGIPAPEQAMGALTDLSAATGPELLNIISALVDPMAERMTANDAVINGVQASLNRSMSQRIANNNRQLQSVMQPIALDMTARAGANDGMLATAMQAVGSGPLPAVHAPGSVPPNPVPPIIPTVTPPNPPQAPPQAPPITGQVPCFNGPCFNGPWPSVLLFSLPILTNPNVTPSGITLGQCQVVSSDGVTWEGDVDILSTSYHIVVTINCPNVLGAPRLADLTISPMPPGSTSAIQPANYPNTLGAIIWTIPYPGHVPAGTAATLMLDPGVSCAPVGVGPPVPPPVPNPPPPNPGPCPPCPVPVPPPQPTPIPPFQCPTIPASLANGIPPPGSDDWCAIVQDLLDFCDGLGHSLGALIDGVLDTDTLLAYLDQYRNVGSVTNPIGYMVDALVEVVRLVVNWAKPILDWLRSIVKCLFQMQSTLFSRCHPTALFGLSVLRSLLQSLHKLRAGGDPAIWATVDIFITLKPLEDSLDLLIQYACPLEAPSSEQAAEAYARGYITEQRFRCIQKLNGEDPDSFAPIVKARGEKLSAREAILYVRRTNGSPQDELDALRAIGFIDPQIASQIQYLYDEVPPVSDMLHFLQRNVYDSQYVADYNLLDGFADRFWSNFGPWLRQQGITQEVAQYHYAAHWIQPAPTQLQEYLYRLRPGKPGVTAPFTLQDYQRILAEQDYAPLARQWFAATAYRVPALGYIRDMYRQGIIDDGELVSYHQDLGYTEDDSKNFLAVDEIQKNRQRASSAHGWTPAALAAAFGTGQISAQEVTDQMDNLGYTDDEAKDLMRRAQIEIKSSIIVRGRTKMITGLVTDIKSALSAGVMNQQQAVNALSNMGYPGDMATGIVQATAATARTGIVKQAIAVIRRSFLGAYIDATGARQMLQSLSLDADAINQYIGLWTLQLTPARKRRTAGQVVNDLANGWITSDEALARLQLMGYTDADSRLFLADAQGKIAQRQAKAQASAKRDARTASREIVRAIKDLERQRKQLLANLSRLASPAKLGQWLRAGIITQGTYRKRMSMLGVDPVDIQHNIDAICSSKGANCDANQIAENNPALGSGGA